MTPRTDRPDEAGLARIFAELRKADEELLPSFRETRDRPAAGREAQRLRLRAGWAAAVLIAAVAAGALLLRRGEPPDPFDAAGLSRWKSPTATLLETPGIELFTTLPAFAPDPNLHVPAPAPERTEAPRKGDPR